MLGSLWGHFGITEKSFWDHQGHIFQTFFQFSYNIGADLTDKYFIGKNRFFFNFCPFWPWHHDVVVIWPDIYVWLATIRIHIYIHPLVLRHNVKAYSGLGSKDWCSVHCVRFAQYIKKNIMVVHLLGISSKNLDNREIASKRSLNLCCMI